MNMRNGPLDLGSALGSACLSLRSGRQKGRDPIVPLVSMSTMANHRPARRGNPLRIAATLIAYLAASWGTIIVLSRGLFPGAGLAAGALALYTTLPLLAFVKWRGWPFY